MVMAMRRKKRGIFGQGGAKWATPQSEPYGASNAYNGMKPGMGMSQQEQGKTGLGTRLLGEGWEGKAAALGAQLLGDTGAVSNYHAQQDAIMQRAAQLAEQQRMASMANDEWYRREDYKRNNPSMTAAQSDVAWLNSLSPEERASAEAALDVLRPITTNTQFGTSFVPRGAMAGQQATKTPRVGEVLDGYEFMGGDPSDQNNWRQAPPKLQHNKASRGLIDRMPESTEDYLKVMGY